MDFNPFVNDWVAVASLVVIPIAGLLANKAIDLGRSKFHLQISQADEAKMDDAVSAGAGMLRAKLATGQMQLPEVIFGNKHVEEVAQTALDIAGAAGNATNITKAEIAARIIGAVGHALGEDPSVPSVATTAAQGPIKTAVAGMLLLAFASFGLAACGTPAQRQAACQTDAGVQPIGAAVLSALVPNADPLISLDTLLVHPAVVKYCAGLGGTPAAAN